MSQVKKRQFADKNACLEGLFFVLLCSNDRYIADNMAGFCRHG